MSRLVFIIVFFTLSLNLSTQKSGVRIALLKYNGGGDWYANPSSLPNLIKFCNTNGIALAVGQDAQVTQAYDLGVVLTAEAQNAAESTPSKLGY